MENAPTEPGSARSQRHIPPWRAPLAAALSAALLTACGAGEDLVSGGGEHTIRLSWQGTDQSVHYLHGALVFKEHVEEASGGELTVETYPSEQLGKADDALTMLRSGITEAAYVVPSYHPELRYSVAWDLPLGLSSDRSAEGRWRAVHENGPVVDEYHEAGIVPIGALSAANTELTTVGRPVPDLESVRGLRIRTGSDLHIEQARAMGGSGVTGTFTEMYELMDRGVADANLFQYGSMRSTGVDSLIRHGTVGLDLPSTGVSVQMGRSFWDGLDEDKQRIVYEAGRVASASATDASIREAEEELELLRADGFETHAWSDEDLEEFDALMDGVLDQWIEDIGGRAPEAVEQARRLAEETEDDGVTDLESDFESFPF
ncbi:hypothetical protein IDM40_06085 [Nocardiopsis sp. HNM0947]|uniref:TRAP-type C4-dicarboxylate transport system, substrate-binding protein n=1 Tax=Nocardiopsis coralli TaxID=2772213 RepID=A0ABR9P398_9ACTN|nr:hypothetical protein [Nocardiopsis coralli]MBE2998275.1 hypothetical protein [Nocardiopsis coralli]